MAFVTDFLFITKDDCLKLMILALTFKINVIHSNRMAAVSEIDVSL